MQDKLRIEGVNSQGFGIIPKLVMRDREITCGAKALYAYICSYAGNGETAWPGRELICKDLNISKNTYNSYLNELKTRDYIRTQQERSKGGIFMHNIFILVSSPQPSTKIWSTEPSTKKRETEKRETKNCDSNKNNLTIKTDIENKQQQGSPAKKKDSSREKDVVVFSYLQKMLKDIGFNDKDAEKIIKKYEEKAIERYVKYALENEEIKKNKAGWVVKALQKNWTIPESKQTDHLAEKSEKLQANIRKAQQQAASPEVMGKYLDDIKNFFKFPGGGNIQAIDA